MVLAAGSGPRPTTGALVLAPRAQKIMFDLAARQANQFESSRIGTEHVLLALMSDKAGMGATVMMDQGLTKTALENWLRLTPGEPDR